MRELQKILDLCQAISSSNDLTDILRHLLQLLSEVVPSRGCAVFIDRALPGGAMPGRERHGGDGPPDAAPLLSGDFTPELRKALAQHREEGILAWALGERRVCLIPSFEDGDAGGFAIIPLLEDETAYGYIWLATTMAQDQATPESVNLVWALSCHASVAILNCLHRRRMEEKINELRILTSVNSLKGGLLGQGPGPGQETGAGAGSLPGFFGELQDLLARELGLGRGFLVNPRGAEAPPGPASGPNASSHSPAGADGPAGSLSLRPGHPGLAGALDRPDTRKLLALADREQVRIEAGDFFASAHPALSQALRCEGLAVLSLSAPETRAPGASAWLLLPLSAADLGRLPGLHGLLLAIVSQARVVAENISLCDSLLAANRNLTSMQWQLVHSGKMAALGQLAGGVAHEINNPLQIMLGRIQMIQLLAEGGRNPPAGEGAPSIKDEIGLVTEEILRIRDIVRNLLDFSRQGKREAAYAPVSLNDTLKDVLALLDHQMRLARVDVRLDLDPANPRILGNRNQLKQIFINLLMNAIHAMEREPRVLEVRTGQRDGMVQAFIRDSGVGISKEDISRIFEPFFSTKAMGTGLGLSISYGLVKDHKGTMEVESQESRGTCFTVSLPRLAEEGMGYSLLVG